MNERNIYKIDSIILALVFGFSIYAPFFLGIIQEDKIASSVEKRTLSILPATPTSLEEIIDYPKEFNTYYSDHFGFREKFTKAYFKLVNKFGDKSSVGDVTTGQDGWLFLGSIKPGYSGYSDPIGDAINVNLFTEKELKDFAKAIVSTRDWLKSRGIEYIYVIAPNKHTIYFEKLPKFISKKHHESATDQLVNYLQQHTNVTVVDLRPALFEAKKKHQIYFKTDTHWNHYGANVAQSVIMNKVKELFPDGTSSSLLTDEQFTIGSIEGGDLARFANIEGVIEEDPQPVFNSVCKPEMVFSDREKKGIFTTTCQARALNAVIFRDSFFVALQPYISREFRRATFIPEALNYNSLVKYVEQEDPDIVIDEIVERTLPYIPSFTVKNL